MTTEAQRLADGIAADIEKDMGLSAAAARRPVVWRSMVRISASILASMKGMKAAVDRQLEARAAGLEARINRLEQGHGERIRALEDRPRLEYHGVWSDVTRYERGSVVTLDGSGWHAEQPSVGRRPGQNPAYWKLMIKRGADARRDDGR